MSDQSIDHLRQQIIEKLDTALTLELSTLPPYLTAYFSMYPNTNMRAANAIRSVFMEEMLHLCLVGNVMVAMGGKVTFTPETLPEYPCVLGFKGREFAVDLAAFSKQSIHTFRRIELPDFMPALDESLHEKDDLSVAGYSIGEFYLSILADIRQLDSLCRAQGQDLCLVDASQQVTETYFWRGGGKPVAVVDLASAELALLEIIEQGEGADISLYDHDTVGESQQRDLAHFFKFNEIYCQRLYHEDDDPRKPPTGEAIEVDYQQAFPIKPNTKQSDFEHNHELAHLNRQFNRGYTQMLKQIAEAYAGNPHVLYNAIMNGMHDLTPIAQTMVRIKIDANDEHSQTGAPSFEWQE